MKIANCYKCKAKIWFAETERGKTMPMNTWGSPKGKIVIVEGTADLDKPLIRFLKKDETVDEGIKRYSGHMGTCRPKK